MKIVLYLAFFVVAVPSYTNTAANQFQFTPQNYSDVSASRRVELVTLLTGAKTVASVWKSVQKSTSIKIHIRNFLNGDLTVPQWYSLHGHAGVLPPPIITQGGYVTEIQFDRTADGGQGTEAILVYTIDKTNNIHVLIQWRVPQFGITESISFVCKILKNVAVDRAYLEKQIKSNAVNLKKSEEQLGYLTDTVGDYSVHSAMGIQNRVTLNVIVTSG